METMASTSKATTGKSNSKPQRAQGKAKEEPNPPYLPSKMATRGPASKLIWFVREHQLEGLKPNLWKSKTIYKLFRENRLNLRREIHSLLRECSILDHPDLNLSPSPLSLLCVCLSIKLRACDFSSLFPPFHSPSLPQDCNVLLSDIYLKYAEMLV